MLTPTEIEGVFLLPALAREQLMRSAATPVTDANDRSRIEAIERCIAWLRMQYPDHFRDDQYADRDK